LHTTQNALQPLVGLPKLQFNTGLNRSSRKANVRLILICCKHKGWRDFLFCVCFKRGYKKHDSPQPVTARRRALNWQQVDCKLCKQRATEAFIFCNHLKKIYSSAKCKTGVTARRVQSLQDKAGCREDFDEQLQKI